MSRVLPDFRDIHAVFWDTMHVVFQNHAHVLHVYRKSEGITTPKKKTYIGMLWLLTPKGDVIRVWTQLSEREATFTTKQMYSIALTRARVARRATEQHLRNKGCRIDDCIALTKEQAKAIEDGTQKERTS